MQKQHYNIQIDHVNNKMVLEVPNTRGRIVISNFSGLMEALKEVGYKIQEPPSILYTQVKDYILSTWSKSCITQDTGTSLDATNGHYRIWFGQEVSSTAFLEITKGEGNAMVPVFDGYIRSIADFIIILELTSVQNS